MFETKHSHSRLKEGEKSERFMPSVEHFYERDVVCLTANDTVMDAAKAMRENHIGDVVITESRNGRSVPIGIITDRDLVVSCLADGKDINGCKISELMTGKVITANESDSLPELVKRMVNEGVSRLPIVDENGELAGILSSKRLFQFFSQGLCELSSLSVQQKEREEKMH